MQSLREPRCPWGNRLPHCRLTNWPGSGTATRRTSFSIRSRATTIAPCLGTLSVPACQSRVRGDVTFVLALSIGAATAVFGVIDGTLLKPLPVHDQNTLLVVRMTNREYAQWPFSYKSFEGMRERLRTVSGVAAHPYAGAIPAAMQRPDGSAASINRTMVTGNWFEVLGVRPSAGRLLKPSDDEKGAAPVAIVSTGAAPRFFGGVRDAIGQTLRVDDTSYTIVGVTPRDFDFPRTADVWVPAVRYRDVG